MPDLQKTGNIGIFFDDEVLVRGCLDISLGKFCQRHEQEMTQMQLVLQSGLN